MATPPEQKCKMKRKIRFIAKQVPGLRSVWTMLRYGGGKLRQVSKIIMYRIRFEATLRNLYPISTDKKLIRFGPEGDGGYLIPDDLDGISACFSPGVSSISGFEKDCAARGIKCYLADASVNAPIEAHPLFEFTKKFLGDHTRQGFITLQNWVDQSSEDPESDLLMQMDIEGFEYEVFASASSDLIARFRIIVVEFHSLDIFDKTKRSVLKKILETHSCVHLHPNNCLPIIKLLDLQVPPIMEFTFLRNDRFQSYSYRRDFPHTLDSDNTSMASICLPECWYRK